MGDLLAELATRQLKELSTDELRARDERIIDAVLANGVAELYGQLADLDEGLGLVERNSSAALRTALQDVESSVLRRYDLELAELQAAAAPVKEDLRREISRTVEAIGPTAHPARPRTPPFYGRKNEVRAKAAAMRDPLYPPCELAASASGACCSSPSSMRSCFSSALGDASDLAVTAWRPFALTAAIYISSVSALLAKPEFSQFVEPIDEEQES